MWKLDLLGIFYTKVIRILSIIESRLNYWLDIILFLIQRYENI